MLDFELSGIRVLGRRHWEFKELDAFFLEGFFFLFGTYPPDVAGFGGTIVYFQCFFGKVAADIVKIFLNIFNGFFPNFSQDGVFGIGAMCEPDWIQPPAPRR